MQSRRDQVQAHLFVMSRLATGMLRGEPDAPDTPATRTSRGTAGGLVLGTALCLVAAVYGVISPGGATGWQKSGTLVMVKETGARFLYLNGALHPVLNEASAKLLAGAQMTIDQVSAASLEGAPRGAPLGIIGAPDEMPAPSDLTTGPWLACAPQQPASAASQPQLTLAISPSQEGAPLTADQGLLVAAPDGTKYLLWHGQRMRLDTVGGALQALGYASADPLPVPQSFVNALPAGPDLAAPDVPGRGSPGPLLAGHPTRVGQLFTAPSGSGYLLTRDGLVPVSALDFALLRGDPRTQSEAYAGAVVSPAPIGPADLEVHTAPDAAGRGDQDTTRPTQPPTLVSPVAGQAVCADFHLSSGAPVRSLTVVDAGAVSGQPPDAEAGVVPGCGPAGEISVSPGRGVMVDALSAAGVGSTEYLITDGGVKYPIASDAAAKQLGYDTVVPNRAPQQLLDLLPTGPSLDPNAVSSSSTTGPSSKSAVCPSASAG
jgi:type VII secretion protein EccB